MKSWLTAFCCFNAFMACNSQLLSGNWSGSNEHSLLVLNPVQTTLEIEIINSNQITGVIHNYYRKGRYEHVKISGTINWEDSTCILIEEAEISHNINTRIYETCLGKMDLKLTRSGNTYLLSGKWKDKNRKLFHCPTLNISFERKGDDRPGAVLTYLNSRETNVQSVIEITAEEIDSIECSLYDNGEIDADSVSVYFNDSLVIKNQRLSEHPLKFYITPDKSVHIHKIRLIADNLGAIPPNTALLIITTKRNRYSIMLSSDFSRNGSVELFLK